jgi:hypothetical protein
MVPQQLQGRHAFELQVAVARFAEQRRQEAIAAEGALDVLPSKRRRLPALSARYRVRLEATRPV